ncbi:MAG TPA: T9SS type A sorting domain-containing protein [Flavobacteriales bacterium]|nr:T9SS type A sorting domain-containing protein [Flavobacteriales bacterium]
MQNRLATAPTWAAALLFLASFGAHAQTAPVNDLCGNVTPATLAIGSTLTFTGNNEGATVEGDYVPGSVLDGFNVAVVWEAFTTSECAQVRIAFCGSAAPFLSEYFWDVIAQQCPANEIIVTVDYNNTECPDGQPVLYFNDLPAGTYYYPVWSVQNEAVGDYVLTVTATACAATGPVADAGPDQQLCTPANTAVMSANTPEDPATGLWTVVSGSFSITDPTDPNTALTGLSQGVNVAEWTVTDANGTASNQVGIFVYDASNPVADAGADQELCMPTNTVSLSGSSVVFPATGTWTLVSGSATLADPSDPNTEVSELAVGQNVFAWTVDNGPCGPLTSDQVSIFVYDANIPAADAGPDQELVAPASSTALSSNAPVFPASGTWALVAGSGMFDDANDPNTAVTGLVVGENIFTWTIDNGPCGTSSDEVIITVAEPSGELPELGPGGTLAFTGNNAGAMDTAGLGFASAWEAFILTDCANVAVDYCATNGFTLFASGLYSEVAGGTLIVADSSSTCANGALIEYFGALEPGTYWIAVLMDEVGALGDYSVAASASDCAPEVPANNLCENAELLVPGGTGPIYDTTVVGDFTGATGTGLAPVCVSSELVQWQDVWYQLDGQEGDVITLSLEVGPGPAAGMDVFRACGDASLACSMGEDPIVLSGYDAGPFFIRVFRLGARSADGTFNLHVQVDRGTGVQGQGSASMVTVHPNPGNGDFTIVPSLASANTVVTVRDMAGREIYRTRAVLVAGQAFQLDLNGRARAGAYLLEMVAPEGSSTVRLLVR